MGDDISKWHTPRPALGYAGFEIHEKGLGNKLVVYNGQIMLCTDDAQETPMKMKEDPDRALEKFLLNIGNGLGSIEPETTKYIIGLM